MPKAASTTEDVTTEVTNDQPVDKTDQQKKAEARNAAITRLVEEHKAEFESLRKQECEARGVEYTARLSPQEKAAKQIADLLAQHPDLASTFSVPAE